MSKFEEIKARHSADQKLYLGDGAYWNDVHLDRTWLIIQNDRLLLALKDLYAEASDTRYGFGNNPSGCDALADAAEILMEYEAKRT
jgi:hypothetical protein